MSLPPVAADRLIEACDKQKKMKRHAFSSREEEACLLIFLFSLKHNVLFLCFFLFKMHVFLFVVNLCVVFCVLCLVCCVLCVVCCVLRSWSCVLCGVFVLSVV